MKYRSYVAALALIVSSVAGSFILGKSIENVKKERYIEVKGLAEREVKADSALWVIPLSAVNDSLPEAKNQLEKNTKLVKGFLARYNLSDDEISKRNTRVYDKLAQYYSPDAPNKPRYVIEEEIVIRSDKVHDVMKASQNISDLFNEGVTISMNQGPRFFFTKLNEIKPEMIADSLNQASKAAQEFATVSHSKVGKIKKAVQGRFSILAREASGSSDQSYISEEIGFINKTVRVVSVIEYYLEG